MASIVPLCTGTVFSFGWASFGRILVGADFCDDREVEISPFQSSGDG